MNARGSTIGQRFSALRGGRYSAIASGPVTVEGAPFSYVICACAGMHATRGLDSITCSVMGGEKSGGAADEDGLAKLINVRSLHLVGIEDDMKTKSEEVSALFRGAKVYVS